MFTNLFDIFGKFMKSGTPSEIENQSKIRQDNEIARSRGIAGDVPIPDLSNSRLPKDIGVGLASRLGGLALGAGASKGAHELGFSPQISNAAGQIVQGTTTGAVSDFRQSVVNEANTRDFFSAELNQQNRASGSVPTPVIQSVGGKSITRQATGGAQEASAARREANASIAPGIPLSPAPFTVATAQLTLQRRALREAKKARKKVGKGGGGGFSPLGFI